VAGLAIGLTSFAAAQTGAPSDPKPAAAPAAAPAPAASAIDVSKPTLFVVGYAHLDTQWRWTYIDTIKEYIPATLTKNFALFEKYPHYVFNFSGSRRYRMMEEYYPAEFAKLKEYIAKGRWFPCGSSVDENDANVPSAESLVRHVLYGNKYFRHNFGTASEEYMLPDCFGFPAALPSVLAHCGVKGFSTQKLTWNAVVPIPFKVGMWEGPDGRSVVAALDPGAYVGEVKENLANSNAWLNRIKATGDKSGVFADYHYFGTGDTGGSPTERSVQMVEESVGTTGEIKVVSGPADLLAKSITPEMQKKLVSYKGELELTEHSAGSVTSEAYMKRWNRKNELLADAAERAAVAAWWTGARPYPSQKLENAWYLVLGSQMHDILPGTSVPKAYDLSWNDEVIAANQFGAVLEDSAAAVIGAMNTEGHGAPIVVYNPTSAEREDIVEAEVPVAGNARGLHVSGPDGKEVPAQLIESGEGSMHRIAFLAKAPPVGYAVYSVERRGDEPIANAALKVSERQLENERYVVKLNDDGDVASIFDKRAKQELLSAPARLGLHYENPKNWPAWNQDWEDRQRPAKAYVGGPAKVRIVENGPARVALEVTRECEGSTFTQRISLSAGGPGSSADRVTFDTDIDWRTRERSLRAAFPLAVSSAAATYDIQTGVIERGNGTAKQFEYAFHQWFDLTGDKAGGGEYGVSVLCDSKYGADKPSDNTVRLTLLHTPGTRGGYPDQGTQDLGRHHVTYALFGHSGDWTAAGAPGQASRLNQPLIPFRATPHAGALGTTFSLAHTSSPSVAITAMKKAEEGDEVIVRLRELNGDDAKGVHIALARPIVSALEVDGQERPLGSAAVQGGELVTDVHGFGLRAFALKLGEPPAKLAPLVATTLPIPYDTDVVSTNSNRADGDFDGKGATIPAEQFPSGITVEGIPFRLGPTGDGQKNALSCRHQRIDLPSGDHDRLCLLMAATEDVQSGLEINGTEIPIFVPSWTGYLGQWDHRLWPGASASAAAPFMADLAGLEPGYIKREPAAWFCSHHHTPAGDAIYEYCYLFKTVVDLPAGAKQVLLPSDPRVKVFAITLVKNGPATAQAAAPLFDTLADHAQDAPLFDPPGGSFTDATDIRVQPRLYWRNDALRYTTDGSEPTLTSRTYSGPITLSHSATIKAAFVGRDGALGPSASANYEVTDRTPPSLKGVAAVFQSPTLRVEFSEPLDGSAADASHFAIDPPLGISTASPSADGRAVILTLAAPPKTDAQYTLTATGVKDAAGNAMSKASMPFRARGPVFTLAEVTPDKRGTSVKEVDGLPIRAKDPWTINMFVRAARQPASHTVFAGFGRCADTKNGAGRYLCKFANGIHFWSRNADVQTRTPLELDRWQMLTATYDGATLRVYKDGRQIAAEAGEFADDDNVVWIAPKDPWDKRYQFEGDIREFTLWQSALSQQAIDGLRASASLP
jgi:alpha-mannosidase